MEHRHHPHAAEIIAAIKALPAYLNPQNLFESELSECYEDSEFIEDFGFNHETGEPNPVSLAVKYVLERCEIRQDVFGWIVEEGDRERQAAHEDMERELFGS